jgi:hypothetical protein
MSIVFLTLSVSIFELQELHEVAGKQYSGLEFLVPGRIVFMFTSELKQCVEQI